MKVSVSLCLLLCVGIIFTATAGEKGIANSIIKQIFQNNVSLANSLRFIVIGDWGGLPYSPFTTRIQLAVAAQMGKVSTAIQSEFTIALGDNFYFDGVKNVEDKRWQETFEEIFVSSSLYKPWYVIAGNHDHHGNVTAQLLYSKLSKRWNFPDFNYTFNYRIPGSSSTVDFIMLDTVLLCGLGDRLNDHTDGPPTGPKNPSRARSMLRWLEDKLSQSRANYLFVGGHYPVYSIAEHGPTKCLVDDIDPLLHKYNVTAYIDGHDHNLQHLVYTDEKYKSKVDYLVVGSANFINPSTEHRHDVPKDSLKFYWADVTTFGGFASVVATSKHMTFTFHKANGNILYQVPLVPRF